MPQPGQSINDGRIAEFLVSDGGRVEAGQPLLTIETDKVELEIPAPVSGLVSHVAKVGEDYLVGELLAYIDS